MQSQNPKEIQKDAKMQSFEIEAGKMQNQII